MLYACLHIFYAFMTYLPFSEFSDISRLCGSSVNIFNLLQISRKISNMFTEKNLYIRGPANSYPCHSRVNYINKPTIFKKKKFLLLSSIILPVYKENSFLSLNRASPVQWLQLMLKVLVTQSCPTLRNPMDYKPPGSSIHGILQPRILEWVAVAFSRRSSKPRGLPHCRQILYHLSYSFS